MKTNKALLVILTPGFPANESDVTCLPFLQNLVMALNQKFPTMEIIILSFQYPFTAKRYCWMGNQVICLGGRNKGGLARRMVWFKARETLHFLHRQNPISALFSLWLGECGLIGKRFARRKNLLHKTWVLGQDARPGNSFVNKMKPGGGDLIAISDAVANEFFGNYLIRPAFVIPNGVDTTQFSMAMEERAIDIIAAGSLIVLKQYHLLVRIIYELKKRYPDVRCLLAGKGPEKESLQAAMLQAGLGKNISLLGEIQQRPLFGFMQSSKIFLHPSSYEGFSMACLEALYAGCHVISFCQPMQQPIAHWHVVRTPEEMLQKAFDILDAENPNHDPVLPYSIGNTAAAMVSLLFQDSIANLAEPMRN